MLKLLKLGIVAIAIEATLAWAQHAPTAKCRNHPGTGFNSSTFLLNRHELKDPAAKCQDGSQASIYYRPCCNGEDKGDFCAESPALWFVVFGDGNQDGWCWDLESCNRRALQHPELTSGVGLPKYFSHNNDNFGTEIGAFSKAAEVNPNFYKNYAAYVPYCSSDLFLGECTGDNGDHGDGSTPQFCGRSILKASMSFIVEEMEKYGVDNVVFVGGAGVMASIDLLRDMLPKGAVASAVCDGCVLFDDLPSSPTPAEPENPPPPPSPHATVDTPSCEDAFSCVPEATLPAAFDYWAADLSDGQPGCADGWRCLLSTAAQGNASVIGRANAVMPVLAQQPLYTETAFTARGTTAGASASFAAVVRSHVEAALAPAAISVASACTSPASSFTYSEFFRVAAGNGSFKTALYELLHFKGDVQNIDSCQTVDCNPSCEDGGKVTSV